MTHQYYSESQFEKGSVESAKLGLKIFLPIVFFIALLLSFIWGVGLVSAVECNEDLSQGGNSCTVSSSLTLNGGTYYGNGSSNSGYININGNNIILDGNGSKLYYGNGTSNSSAIFSSSRSNITIKNFTLIDLSVSGSKQRAIEFKFGGNATITNNNITGMATTTNYLVHTYQSSNNLIENNIITLGNFTDYGVNNYGIYSESSLYDIVRNNNVYMFGGNVSDGILFNNNVEFGIIENNYVLINTTGAISGIKIAKSSNNTIYNNTVINYGTGGVCKGIFLESGSSYNNISFNNLTTYGLTGYGVSLDTNIAYNNIFNNSILTFGQNAHGVGSFLTTANFNSSFSINTGNRIYFNSITTLNNTDFTSGIWMGTANSSLNYIYNNSISSKKYNIYLQNGPTYNFIYDNIFTGSDTRAIYVNNANHNNIFRNNISVNGTGILFSTTATNNSAYDNSVFSNSTTSGEAGIYVSSSANCSLINNFVRSYGSNTYALRVSSSNNTFVQYGNYSSYGSSNSYGAIVVTSDNLTIRDLYLSSKNTYSLFSQTGNFTVYLSNVSLSSKLYNLGISSSITGGLFSLINSQGSFHILGGALLDKISFNNYDFLSVNQSDIVLTQNYFYINNSNNTVTSTYQITPLTSALLTNGTSLCNGSSSNLALNTGQVNITLLPSGSCYVLDEFALTEGVNRENSPITFGTDTTTSKHITSTLDTTINTTITINADCNTIGRITYVSDLGFTKKFNSGDYTCSNGYITFTNLPVDPSLTSNIFTLEYNQQIQGICDKGGLTFYGAVSIVGVLLTIFIIGLILAILVLSFRGTIDIGQIRKNIDFKDFLIGIITIMFTFLLLVTIAFIFNGFVCSALGG